MDKKIILAVAGSGKTQYLINKIKEDSRILIVTYTQNNTKNLRNRIIKEFGYIPAGVRIYTYFSFIMSFCVKPIMGCDIKIKGISYDPPKKYTKKGNKNYY